MSNKSANCKRKKYKFRLSTFLGKYFYIFIFIAVYIFDLIFLNQFEFDIKNVFIMTILVLINVPAIVIFIRYFIYLFRYWAHIWQIRWSNKSSQARGGSPGSGKSSSMYNDSIIKADMAWRTVCYEYFLLQHNILKVKENRSAAWDRKAITECYNFYKKHPEYIPCLYTKPRNVIYDSYGRRSQICTLKHLEGNKKLLYRAVIAYDEIGQDLPAMTKFMDDINKDINLKEVADFMRYLRHFGNFSIIFTEQDVSNMYIGNRRVTDENLLFIGQETVLRPTIFKDIQYFNVWLIGRIQAKAKILSKGLSVLFARYFIAFDNFISHIGFRKYKYKVIGNVDKSLVAEKKGSFILMPHLNCWYDNRANKYIYKAANNDYFVDNEFLNEEPLLNDITKIGFVIEPK